MKNRLLLAAIILLVAVLAGSLAFVASYRAACAPACCRNHASTKELGWLRHEYHLSDAQFERIEKLHAEHAVRCAAMCQRIDVQRARLSTLIQASPAMSPEVSEALKATVALESECRESTLAHIYAVAAVMPPEEGRRYVAMMSASIITPGAPGKAAHSVGHCEMTHSR